MDHEGEEAQYQDGPDQILPATSGKAWTADGYVRLYLTADGPAAQRPVSVYSMFQRTAQSFPDHLAMAVKRDSTWQYWSYKQYFEQACTVAKAFIKLGLDRFHAVCIMGFNSPEWALANFGAIFAGGLSTGIYTTNSPEACRYLMEDCQAQIVVVEDLVCLNKVLAVKHQLPHIKAIVQWLGVPGAPGVLSWPELLAVGAAEEDALLQHRLSLAAVNQCCSLIYTSGTTGPPKGVMCSQDNLTWISHFYLESFKLNPGAEVAVSYLPMSHMASQLVDLYLPIIAAGAVYFAQPDALKGTLLQTLLEVRPTVFLGVPRVWEKMYEKMQEAAASVGGLKRAVATWAKYHGLNHYTAIRDGRQLSRYEGVANYLAKTLIINRVKGALGLDRTKQMASGSAPISTEVLEYFMSLDLPIMEGYGLSESMSICSFCRIEPGMFRLGSVGKVVPFTRVELRPCESCRPGEGEVVMQGRNVVMGYLNLSDKTHETIDDDGWLYSGDIGRFDEDGFLYITGRIKELVITAGGENVPPVLIEDSIKKLLPFISFAVLQGDHRKYLSMLLTLKCETDLDTGEPLDQLTSQCQAFMCQLQLPHLHTVSQAVQELQQHPQGTLATAIQQGINRYNQYQAISSAQRVQRWQVLPRDFSLVTGELNNTLKLKRRFVMEKYTDVIDSMYTTPDPFHTKSKL